MVDKTWQRTEVFVPRGLSSLAAGKPLSCEQAQTGLQEDEQPLAALIMAFLFWGFDTLNNWLPLLESEQLTQNILQPPPHLGSAPDAESWGLNPGLHACWSNSPMLSCNPSNLLTFYLRQSLAKSPRSTLNSLCTSRKSLNLKSSYLSHPGKVGF